ncbi:histone acetyltransferase KAT6A-like [Cyanistes caeruleus]|uniref:histone acetyltransferase KAT6A-like n=1 Tax=Cyanistes caeruleus TaxID=156563 RepID=UPI000CDAE721|nr:histone acetyltransferase KAT6A-like [Cyanistes caeruleus]
MSQVCLETQQSDQHTQEQRDLEQSMAAQEHAAAPGERELVPISSPASSPSRSQAQLDSEENISSETMSQVCLETQQSDQHTQEQRDLEQSMAAQEHAAAAGERELVPISAPHSPSCSPSPVSSPLQSLTLSKLLEEEEEAERGSVRSEQEGEEAVLAGELELSQCKDKKVTELLRGDAGSYKDMSQGEACGEQDLSQVETSSNHELSDWDDYNEQELSKGEARSTDKFSDWEECLEQELSLREVVGSPALSEWEAYREQELSQEDLGSYQEPSDWEESIDQQCAREEDFSSLEVPEENGNLPSTQSSFEDYRDRELKQGNWHSTSAHSITVKPLLPEDDDGDGVSLLELHEQASERTQGGFAGEELPVPKPREAWGECQPGPHRKRPSRVRRALRALRRLCCCPCLAPQLED